MIMVSALHIIQFSNEMEIPLYLVNWFNLVTHPNMTKYLFCIEPALHFSSTTENLKVSTLCSLISNDSWKRGFYLFDILVYSYTFRDSMLTSLTNMSHLGENWLAWLQWLVSYLQSPCKDVTFSHFWPYEKNKINEIGNLLFRSHLKLMISVCQIST